MNKIRPLARVLFAALLALGAGSSHAKEYILLGKLGDTLLCDDATSKTQGIAKLDLYKDEIGEAVMGEDSERNLTLYVQSAADHESYLLQPFAPSKEYEKLPSQEGEFFRGILYDRKNKGPAVVAQKGREFSDLITLHPEGERVRTSIEDCLFVQSNIPRERVPLGHQNDGEMGYHFPGKSSEFIKRPNRGWVLAGQSESTTIYNRTIPLVRNGEKGKNSLFFIDRSKGNHRVFDFEDVGRPYAFTEVVVIRGMILTPKNGAYYGMPPNSGNYSFYYPGADELVKCTVDSKMMIVFADSTTAFFAKGNDLYKMPISRTGCGTPVRFLSLDFEVFQMFPVPEKKP